MWGIIDYIIIGTMANVEEGMTNVLTCEDLLGWIGPFDGHKDSYANWKEQCNRAFERANKFASLSLLRTLQCRINVLRLVNTSGVDTWIELKKRLDEHFQIKLNILSYIPKLYGMKKGDKTDFVFYLELMKMHEEYGQALVDARKDEKYINYHLGYAMEVMLHNYLKQIDIRFRAAVIVKGPENIKLARTIVKELEERGGYNNPGVDSKGIGAQNAPSYTQFKRQESNNNDTHCRVVCQFCDRPGHSAKICYDIKNGIGFQRRNGRNRNVAYNNYYYYNYYNLQLKEQR